VNVDGGGYVKIAPADTQADLRLYRDDATINTSGIAIGDINFGGADADNDNAARLRVKSDGAWTSTSSPTAFEFQTCPSGSESPQTRLVIDAEGTWTPTLPNGGTLSTNSATYTRVGNICHIQFYVSGVSPTADAIQFRIGGLPFTVSDITNYFAAGSIGYVGDGQFVNYRLIGNNNTTTMYFHSVAGTSAALSNNDFISQFSGSNLQS
jgi:hypothetical protein